MRLLAVLISALWLCCQTVQAQVRTYDEMIAAGELKVCLLYTSPSPRDRTRSRMPSSA